MNGIIVVNKKSGMSSSSVVQRIKHLLNAKCGHLGTLDPLAEGVLPVAINRATRLFDYFLNKTKTYVVTIRFGYETDTLDEEGEVKFTSDVVPSIEQISDAISRNLLGQIMQLPPQYSSKKLNGIRAYEVARKGGESDLKPVPVTIYSFRILEQIDNRTFKAEVVCSSGTYIRSLCRDLGRLCNTFATMYHLLRTRCGQFNITSAVDLDTLTLDNIDSFVLPLDSFLSSYPSVNLSEKQLKTLLDGKKLKFHELNLDNNLKNENYIAKVDNKIVGIGQSFGEVFKMKTYLI